MFQTILSLKLVDPAVILILKFARIGVFKVIFPYNFLKVWPLGIKNCCGGKVVKKMLSIKNIHFSKYAKHKIYIWAEGSLCLNCSRGSVYELDRQTKCHWTGWNLICIFQSCLFNFIQFSDTSSSVTLFLPIQFIDTSSTLSTSNLQLLGFSITLLFRLENE